MKVNILIVDDHPYLRKAVRQTLEQQPNLRVVGEAATGATAVSQAEALRPDLILMDIHLPDMSGIEATRRILEAVPAVRIVIFSADALYPLVESALRAGAHAHILKGSAVDELIHAIELVLAGKLYLSPEANAGVVEQYRKSLVGKPIPPKPVLSDRETQLLRLIVEGRRNKEIAEELKLSTNSIETYRVRLMKKVGCSGTAQLVRYAIREGIAVP
jgi:DNA-binding NarL/FixJ family response regulator